MTAPAENVVITLPCELLQFAQSCADDRDISRVVVSALHLLAEELDAFDAQERSFRGGNAMDT